MPFSVASQWYKGSAEINTFELEELLGTKVRAMYQRRKGRDLFDLYMVLTETNADPNKIANAFHEYMRKDGNDVSQKEFISNMERKMRNKEFHTDIESLLKPGSEFNTEAAWELVRSKLIELL